MAMLFGYSSTTSSAKRWKRTPTDDSGSLLRAKAQEDQAAATYATTVAVEIACTSYAADPAPAPAPGYSGGGGEFGGGGASGEW